MSDHGGAQHLRSVEENNLSGGAAGNHRRCQDDLASKNGRAPIRRDSYSQWASAQRRREECRENEVQPAHLP
jgi:hypothetical protein